MLATRYQKLTAWVLLAAFAVSLAYSFYFSIDPVVDARAYDTIAWNVVAGKGYAETPEVPRVLDFSIGRVGPAYELFLALIYFIFGHHYQIVWILQAILHVASGALLFLIAKRLFKENGELIGLIAAAFFVFFIDTLELASMLMTETLMLTLLLLSVYLFIRFYERPTGFLAMFLGLTTALAMMVRPTLLLFLFVFLGFCIWKRYFRQGIIMLICFLALLSPWAIRNYNLFDRVILTTAAGGYDLWVGNHSGASGELASPQFIEDYAREHSIFETNKKGISEVLGFVLRHPFEEAKILLYKTSIYFSVARPAAFWFHLHGIERVITGLFSSGFAFLLFGFGLSGAWLLWKRRDELSRALILLALTAPISVIPIVVETRYRYSLYPFLALAAGYVLSVIIRKGWRQSVFELKVVSFAFCLIFVNTIFDFLRNLDTVKDKLGL